MKTVYLSGGIMGCTDAEAKDWRRAATQLLEGYCHVIDPMARDCRNLDMTFADMREVIEADHDDILASDFLLVNATRPSWGTAMEVYLAANWGKKIVSWVGLEDKPVSIWLVHYSSSVHKKFGDAVDAVRFHPEAK